MTLATPCREQIQGKWHGNQEWKYEDQCEMYIQ